MRFNDRKSPYSRAPLVHILLLADVPTVFGFFCFSLFCPVPVEGGGGFVVSGAQREGAGKDQKGPDALYQDQICHPSDQAGIEPVSEEHSFVRD